MRNRGQTVLLVLIMAAAMLLCFVVRQKRMDRQAVLEDVTRLSQESNAAWHATDDAKLDIQAENQRLTEEIREAELQEKESTRKIADIEPQLEELRNEKAGLEADLSAADQRKAAADSAKTDAERKKNALTEAIGSFREATESGDTAAANEARKTIERILKEK